MHKSNSESEKMPFCHTKIAFYAPALCSLDKSIKLFELLLPSPPLSWKYGKLWNFYIGFPKTEITNKPKKYKKFGFVINCIRFGKPVCRQMTLKDKCECLIKKALTKKERRELSETGERYSFCFCFWGQFWEYHEAGGNSLAQKFVWLY